VGEVGHTIDDTGDPVEPGLDHDWFPWSPLPERSAVVWPGGHPVAVSVVFDLGAVEWEHPGAPMPVPPPGGRGMGPYPDFPRMSHREFGHRVGVFRLLEIMDRLGITPAAAIDVLTVEHYAALLDHLDGVGEFLAAGLSASRPLTSAMDDDEERHYLASTLERLEARLGVRPTGWLGPGHSESTMTPARLHEAGLGYVADWANDEQPYPMPGAGDLWAFPLSWELSDVSAMFIRGVSPWTYAQSVKEAFEVLVADGAGSGRVLALHLSPWLSGQAFRADAVADALGHIRDRGQAWITTPTEIVDWCRQQAAG
jgi:hypothetical protein